MGKRKGKLDTDGGQSLSGENPFASLDSAGLPEGETKSQEPAISTGSRKAKPVRGRLELRRLKAGKGGKVVTEIRGLSTGQDLKSLARELKQRCGTGGTVKEGGVMEIQGDYREVLKCALEERGHRVVLAGG